MTNKFLAGAALAAALIAAAPASAASFVFSGPVQNNSVTAKSDGVSVVATAWSGLTRTSLPYQTKLGSWDQGLGVTNKLEGDGSLFNSHTVDNIFGHDFIALQFSKAVNLTGMTLNAFSVNGGFSTDKDAWVSVGNFDASADFGTQWKGFLKNGFEVASNGTLSTSAVGTTWLIGASRSGRDIDDGFKLRSVTANAVVAAVPEPATWMSMILGFGVVGGVMRRRTKVNFAIA